MNEWTDEDLRLLVQKIAEDSELQALAVRDPKAAIEKVTGRQVEGVVADVLHAGSAEAEELAVPKEVLVDVDGRSTMDCCHIPNALQISCV